MATVHLLGTGAAVTAPHRTTVMLAFTDADHTFLVDCGGDVVHRLLAAGIDPDTLEALFITHEHPDHVAGFPLFMEKIWLGGRRRPLPIYGIAEALSQARRCFATFDTSRWEGLPEMQWRTVAHEAGAHVLEDDTWRITAAPGIHSVPVVGVRVESKRTGGVVVYSCDTEPSAAIEQLATGADVLVHEANGATPGHTSAQQAAQLAQRAGVRGPLVLIHLPAVVSEDALAEAREYFPNTLLGEELATFAF